MRGKGSPKDRERKRPAKVIDGWCPTQVVRGPGKHRCSKCGRRLMAHPFFDDGHFRPPPGTGRETIALRGIGAADGWFLKQHKTKQ